MIKTIIKENSYLDSIFLMNAAKELKKVPGVNQAILVMGSEMNKTVLEEIGQLTAAAAAATPNDLIISVDVDGEGAVDDALQRFAELVTQRSEGEKEAAYIHPTLESALSSLDEANLALISVPGEFAAREVERALDRGLHTFIFSDNVSLEDEVALKKKALAEGLLVMGPGCGAALINHVALGLMSAVGAGPVGIVGASGSGLQEIAVLLDHLGSGVSQAIGTGGRDPSAEVGGITMLQGLRYLAEDEQTEVVVLVSKPPAAEVAEKILAFCKDLGKPVVVNFLGGGRELVERAGALYAATLEEAALKAVALLPAGKPAENFIEKKRAQLSTLAAGEKEKPGAQSSYLRGLFCGGTHSEEAILILQDFVEPLYSNLSIGRCRRLDDFNKSKAHSIIDMGAEEFTRGMPHPVIDPFILNERLRQEGSDPQTAVLLFDLILGYGAHPDPAGAIWETLAAVKEEAAAAGRNLSIVASICGSTKDPQGFAGQKKRLEESGVLVLPSNAQAAALAGMIIAQRSCSR